MASPTEIQDGQPVAFEADLFWDLHKAKIIGSVIALVVGLAIYGGWQITSHNRAEAAKAALAAATTEDALTGVISSYSGSAAAGDAHVLLAAKLRDAGKFDESTKVLRDFIANYPKHPMIAGATLSLAVNLDAQDKTDEALAAYEDVTTRFGSTYAAPIAALARATIFEKQGKIDETKRVLEDTIAQYPESLYVQEAKARLQGLRR